jgi:DNA-binding response OmpR family regulator
VADPDATERARVRALLLALSTPSGPIQVREASDRRTLDDLLSAGKPALIVTELLLEGGSGFDLLRRLSERFGGAPPPVVVVTELSREVDRYWSLRNGAHAFVSKPYDDGTLRERLAQALAGAPRARM